MKKENNWILVSILILVLICWLIYIVIPDQKINTDIKTLKLVHVIVRHGNRNPDKVGLWPDSKYYDEKYYPEGYGQLTNEGKRKQYEVGVSLRKRYDGFLDRNWNIKTIDALSSKYNRTKMSLQMILAGLYPPEGSQIWGPIQWQPIPYNYISDKNDSVFLSCLCPKYLKLEQNLLSKPIINSNFKKYEAAMKILENKYNRTVDLLEIYKISFGLEVLEQLGFPLEDWIKDIYPEPLRSLPRDKYLLATNTTLSRRYSVGAILKKIINNIGAKINGIIEPKQRKAFIYSGHEINLAPLLIVFGVFDQFVHVPPYGAYLLLELHKIDGVYGIKILYQDYKGKDPVPIKISGCHYFCPYNDFYNLMRDYLWGDDQEC